MDIYKKIYYLGHFFGSEDLYNEYKEVCLYNLNLFFDYNEVYYFVKYNIPFNIIKWNNMINEILFEYMIKYVPKYIGNFSKAEIEGYLYIGVDDNGFVEGIPYHGHLEYSKIREYILYTKIFTRGFNENYNYDNEIVDWYYNNLNIEIIELNTKFDNMNKIYKTNMEYLNIIESENKLVETKWNKYKNNYSEWLNSLNKYSGKLITFLIDDEMRNNLINFVKMDFSKNPSYDQHKLNEILKYYNQDKNIFYNTVFSINDIENVLKDKYSPIGYIMKFKDYIVDEIRKLKPIHPLIKPDNNIYYRFANKISNIRAHLHNLEYKFYFIKITIPYRLNTYIEYRFSDNDSWICKSRTIIMSGPNIGSPSCL